MNNRDGREIKGRSFLGTWRCVSQKRNRRYVSSRSKATHQVKNLIPHFIQEKQLAGTREGSFEAYTMFVDMSGFTRLTEVLLKKGTAGAERLSDILNAIFGPMVKLVYAHGGFIPYFAGDSFIGIFPVDACSCRAADVLAFAQRLFELLGESSAQFKEFQIGIKIGLSYGNVAWGIVGERHQSFYFRGAAIEGCANGQTQAKQAQIVVDEAFARQLPASVKLEPCPLSGHFWVMDAQAMALPEERPAAELPDILPEVAARFLPKALMEFNQQGEFRTVVAVFISFEGLEEFRLLNEFSTIVLDHIHKFSGYFKEIDFGDKGGVLVAFFGAPVSFENSIERALEFVCALQEDLVPMQQSEGLRFKVGIAEGIAYTGIVGGVERYQYAAVGNRVNVAARLMMHADWGEVWVDEAVQKNRHFRFQHKGNITYKGMKDPIPSFRLMGRNQEQQQVFEGAMVGRESEIQRLEKFAEAIFNNSNGGVAYVYGEAGIGKTRIAYELCHRLRRKRKLNWLTCQSDQILRKPFNPFTYFLRNYFEQSPDNSPKENLKNFEQTFSDLLNDLMEVVHPESEHIKREVIRTKPILAALTGLKITNSLWENLDAKGRYQNTLAALNSLFLAEALLGPIVIELEDGHWFDSNSIEFLNDFAGHAARYPIFLLVTSRYDDEGNKPLVFDEGVLSKNGFTRLEVDLNILDPEAMNSFARQRLKDNVHPDLLDLLLRTTNGNPFYAEQMLEYFNESNQLKKEAEGWSVIDKNVRISNSIHAVLTARIDRLSGLVKETIKAAAVIGREFELPVLSEIMQKNEELSQHNGNAHTVLKEQVKVAERAQIWQAMNELRYIFRHSLLREAVYDMQLKTRLRELHRLIGEAIEKLYDGNLKERYVDLVFHYEQADVEHKLQEYLRKAADHAKEHYQNLQALHFYNKLLAILEKNGDILEQTRTLLKKASILELIGRWDECEATDRQALDMARQTNDSKLLGHANNSLGYLLMLKGKYDEADGFLESAAAFFGSIHDNRGTSKVYGNLGTLYFRQGKYEDAKLYFIRSIQLAQLYKHTPSNAQIVATLGLTYMNLGKYDDGIRWQQSQLDICKQVNDRQGMATLYTNMGIVYFEKGDYDAALSCYEKGLALSEELGNKQLTSIAVGCIGSVWQRKGRFDLALQHFERDLALTEELGDKQGISIALGLLGELFSVMGNFDQAIEYLKRNLVLGEELGYKKGVAKALNTLGDIYYYKNELQTSLTYYDRSIEVTRSIGNKLVLGFSMVEKANVLLATDRVDEAKDHLRQATNLAEELKHPDLLFEVKLLAGKIAAKAGNQKEAAYIFESLLALNPGKQEAAALHYELGLLDGAKEHRTKAHELYKELYEETPMYAYRLRIEEVLDG